MADLMLATLEAVFSALDDPALTDLAPVFSNVPPNRDAPFVEIGAIDAEDQGAKGDPLTLLSVEVEFRHRGGSRVPLLAMMHAARGLLEGQALAAAGVGFGDVQWIGSATDREDDGVTWHGIHRFALFAQDDD